MNFKYKISTFMLSAVLFIATACNDFVDLGPEYSQDADNYFLSPDDYEKALIGAYDLLQTSYLSVWIGEIASDNSIAGGESASDTEGLHQIENMTHGGVNAELRSVWRY